MTARRHGHGAPRAATSRMGAIVVAWTDGHPRYADDPRTGNRACRRSAAGITRDVPQ
jgi:hypothetical protein